MSTRTHSWRPCPRPRYLGLVAAMLLGTGGLVACEKEAPETIEQVRAIKTTTVSQRASGQLRKFPGVIEAVDTSALSFEVAGNVRELKVDVGDRFKSGEVLSALDRQTFELSVESAKAALGRARADEAEKRTEFERQDALYKKQWVARSAQEQALAAYESAQNQVRYRVSELNLARRDLEKTELLAPLDGVVARRYVDAFAEVSRGQTIFDVYVEGAMEAKISVPEGTVRDIYLGLPAEVRFLTGPIGTVKGRVSEIGTQAEAGNVFPVKVAILEQQEGALPGMTTEVSLILGGEDEAESYLVPISALAPGVDPQNPREGYIFVFDPETSAVKRTPVKADGVRDNLVVITEGVTAGDVVAIAGVSFLKDGQEVKLLSQ
ncbi:MAG: efflux RND transporter periplasmic adaptor subunit [Kiloniellales bacterium]|nr:efflux RND transporter periplasmic adaptor subunit [Kiloniellales bacterium]